MENHLISHLRRGVSSFIELNNLPCLELLGRTLCGEVFKNKNVKCLMELIILITVSLFAVLFRTARSITFELFYHHYLAPAHDSIVEILGLRSTIPLR